MRRLDHVLSRVAERGDPLGADLLIERLEHKLAGEPDPIVVARQRSGIMQTFEERTGQQPGPPTRRRGLAVALASFIVVVIAGGGLLMWAGRDDDSGREVAATTTTQAATTTEAPSAVAADPVGTFTFDGTTWTYDGPSSLEAGSVTFSLVNTSDQPVGVFSWFGLEGGELAAELATSPVGTDIGDYATAPPPPPSDFMLLVEAGPGETVSGTSVMGLGEHLIDARTTTGGSTDHLWRVAVIEVVRPASRVAGDPVGTFTFDGTTWTYDGPTSLEAGSVTFSLVNTSSEEVAVVSWFGLEGEELAAELASVPFGTDFPMVGAPPPPPSDFMYLVEAGPGETVTAMSVMGLGEHLIDGVTETDTGDDHIWRLTNIFVIEP